MPDQRNEINPIEPIRQEEILYRNIGRPGRYDDEEIRANIILRINNNPRIKSAGISVEVNKGSVTLKGSVPSLPARIAAHNDAYFSQGVTEIHDFLLVVFPPELALPTDREIRNETCRIIRHHKDLFRCTPHIEVDGGILTIRGEVPWYWQKDRINHHLADIPGIVDLENELVVIPPEPISDAGIRKSFWYGVHKSFVIQHRNLDLDIVNGNVRLRGVVFNTHTKFYLGEIAKNIPGVVDIRNEIMITYP